MGKKQQENKYQNTWEKYNNSGYTAKEVMIELGLWFGAIAIVLVLAILFPGLAKTLGNDGSFEIVVFVVFIVICVVGLGVCSVFKFLKTGKREIEEFTLSELYAQIKYFEPDAYCDFRKIVLHYNNSTLEIAKQGNSFLCDLNINDKPVASRFIDSKDILAVVAEFYHEKSPGVEEIVVFDKQIKQIANGQMKYVDEFGRLHVVVLDDSAWLFAQKHKVPFSDKKMVCEQKAENEFDFCLENFMLKIIFDNKKKKKQQYIRGTQKERIEKFVALLKENGFSVKM